MPAPMQETAARGQPVIPTVYINASLAASERGLLAERTTAALEPA